MLLMSAENQRSESRVKSRGRFELQMEGAEPVVGEVCDVSLSGICLEAERKVEIGTPVRLDGDDIVADGVVRYCALRDGRYRIGIALLPPD
jgi:hypothetical protein